MSTELALAATVALLLANAFFVGSEFAVMAARRSQLEPLAEQGNKRAARCLEAMEQVASVLACAQLGITVCSVLLGAIAEPAFHHLLAPLLDAAGLSEAASHAVALGVALMVVAYLHIVVGEMIPKNLSISRPEAAALILAPPLLFLTKLFRPVIAVMSAIAKACVRLLGIEPKDELASTFTAEEVGHIVEESAREGLIEEPQRGMTNRVLEFSDHTAGDVAIPVHRLVTVSLGVTPEDVELLVAEHGYSRFPVLSDDAEPIGYLHVKDVLYADSEERLEPVPTKRVRRLATAGIDDEVEEVLATMQETGAHLARAVDPQGKVIGIVFLEDVLEELIGEVSDAMARSSHS